jgi:catechol 2,3-dioxygenase-like lactoylglutathione lyase family enzyme
MTDLFRSSREVILRTEKWSEAVRFYGSVLGLPVAYETPTMVGFETGEFRLYVEKGPPHPPVFEFLVPDVAGAKERLLAAGCRVVEEDPSLPRCYIRDPFGMTFNLGPASPSN